jgi:hypothetical protein
MKEKRVKINKGQRLHDILKGMNDDNNIPSNAIICKTLTGIGATYSEIHSKRNSIIIEPNIPVILGKLEKHNDLNLEAVYSKCEPIPIKKYLIQNNEHYKKIFCTPESFKKIREAANELGINIYKDYFCLFDECEKIIQDVDYRQEITQPIYDFFEFENKALVSATTLEMRHPDLEKQGFCKYIIDPTFDYKKEIELIDTNDFYKSLNTKLSSLKKSNTICIFVNKTDTVNHIIDKLGIKDYKVFCSQKSVRKLKLEREKFNSFENLDLPLAKYNFFTSRFFSAVDIELRKNKPDIIMLTHLKEAQHTMIDPFTEAIQIVGRFRNGVNSITHITNINETMKIKSDNELEIEIEQYKRDYESIMNNYNSATQEIAKEACSKSLDALPYTKLILDKQRNINYFSVDNLYNEERIKQYYTNINLLKEAYKETGHFEVIYEPCKIIIGEDNISKLKNTSNNIERYKRILKQIQNIEKIYSNSEINLEEKNSYINMFKVLKGGEFIINAYNIIGRESIEKAGYKKTNIKQLIKIHQKKEAEIKRYSPEVLKEIKEAFNLEVSIPQDEAQQILKQIFEEFQIIYKVKKDTIKDYFECSSSHSKEKNYPYKLHAFKIQSISYN